MSDWQTQLIHWHKKPVRLVIDRLPGHKKAVVKQYVASTAEKLALHLVADHRQRQRFGSIVFSPPFCFLLTYE